MSSDPDSDEKEGSALPSPIPSGPRSVPTVVAPLGSVTKPDGTPASDKPPPRQTPLIDAPSDLAIPMRTNRSLEGVPLDVRTAFLLCHVDGRSSIAEIAVFVERPVAEVASGFGLLTAMGAVELIGNLAAPRAPSGVRAAVQTTHHDSGVRPAIIGSPTKKTGENG